MTNCICCSFHHSLVEAYSEQATGQNSPKKNWRHILNLDFSRSITLCVPRVYKSTFKTWFKNKASFYLLDALGREYMAS